MLSVQVGSFATGFDAELVRVFLESEGIPARIEGDMLAGAAQPLSGGVGVRLLVAPERAPEALELIAKHERELAASRRHEDTEDDKVTRAWRLALLGWMILPFIAQIISLYQLSGINYQRLTEKGRRRFGFAIGFDLLVVLAVGLWLAR